MTIQPQVSFVVMDQYTGHVLAIAGGRGEKKRKQDPQPCDQYGVRQPGSTLPGVVHVSSGT